MKRTSDSIAISPRPYAHSAAAHVGRQARAQVAPDRSDPIVERLTARERDVLSWLATGTTDRQIAAMLGVSPRTVHKHLEHVYQKLGVATRTAAVVRVLEISILP